MAKIIENRGGNINYPVYEGTKNECLTWLNENTVPHPVFPMRVQISKNFEYLSNGNGEPFEYIMTD